MFFFDLKYNIFLKPFPFNEHLHEKKKFTHTNNNSWFFFSMVMHSTSFLIGTPDGQLDGEISLCLTKFSSSQSYLGYRWFPLYFMLNIFPDRHYTKPTFSLFLNLSTQKKLLYFCITPAWTMFSPMHQNHYLSKQKCKK